jgi:hypothetical protein
MRKVGGDAIVAQSAVLTLDGLWGGDLMMIIEEDLERVYQA